MVESNFLSLFDIIIGIYTIAIFQFLVIVYTFIKSMYQYRILSQEKEWEEKIDDEIFLSIFNENITDNPIIRQELPSDRFKNYCIKKILHALISFSGNSKSRVIHLYYHYQLEQYSIRKISSKNKYKIAEALQEVTAIGLDQALPHIQQLLQHPNDIVRDEAQYAMVKFKGIKGLDFLNAYSYPITLWQQIKLLNAIETITAEHHPLLLEWLKSSNESVVILALRLIHKFQILEFEDELLKMLNTCSTDIKIQIIKTFASVNSLYTADQLIEYYNYQPDEVIQFEILKIIRRIGEPHHQHFLLAEAVYQPNLKIKKKAIKVLISITGIEQTLEMLNSIPQEEQKVLLHQIILEYK